MTTPTTSDQTRVTLGGDAVSLSGDDLDLVLHALAALECREAAAVAEQIAALRVAGGTIDLMPNEAERDALQRAVERLAGARGESAGGLADLAAVCADDGSTDEERVHGRMLWFNVDKGYGFIRTDDDERLPVARAGFRLGHEPEPRCKGREVAFAREPGAGEPYATDVCFVVREEPRRARLRSSRGGSKL